MSEAIPSEYAVLLPTARVHVFSHDEATRLAVAALSEDWRYARVSIEVFEGGADQAQAKYSSETSPDVLIVETPTIDDSFSEQLEGLAGYCDEGTSAIIVGPDNDVQLYRRLVSMGVSDYLVNPVSSADISNVIAKSLIEKHGVTGSKLIAFVGAKGGVGTSTLAQNFAVTISGKVKQKTFILDAGGGWAYLSRAMANNEPSGSLAEAVRMCQRDDEEGLKRLMVSYSDELEYLSSGSEPLLSDPVDAEGFEALIDYIMGTYPIVVCDLSNAPAHLKTLVLSKAAQVFVVTTPVLSSLRGAGTIIKESKDIRGGSEDNLSLVVNQRGFAGGVDVGKADIEVGLGLKIDVDVPYLPKVFCVAESKGLLACKVKGAEKVWDGMFQCVSDIFHDSKSADKTEKSGGIGALLGLK